MFCIIITIKSSLFIRMSIIYFLETRKCLVGKNFTELKAVGVAFEGGNQPKASLTSNGVVFSDSKKNKKKTNK